MSTQTPPALSLICPAPGCRGALAASPDGSVLHCAACGRDYPLTDGIPRLLGEAYDHDIEARYERDGAAIEDTATAVGYEFNLQHEIMRNVVAEALADLPPGSRILDVGCGHGKFTQAMTRAHPVVGVDLAVAMLQRARAEGLEVYQADATALPFDDDQFDAIVCAEMIQHLTSLDALAAEFKRVLKPGGRVIVTTLNRTSLLRRLFRAVKGGKTRPLWRSGGELATPFQAAGFRVHRLLWTHSPLRTVRTTTTADNPLSFLAANVILDARL